jgi:hypothetical protein
VAEEEWVEIARRNARSVQTTVGWIFWDPIAIEKLDALGVANPFGYIAARCAPLGPAGPEAVIAAFGSISPIGIRIACELVAQHTTFEACWQARDEAIVLGLDLHAPDIVEPLREIGPVLWPIIEQLPTVGRVFFAAHLRMARPSDATLSGWHAVNCLREWRGDTHWALVAAAGLTGTEASIIHNAWLGYDRDWLPQSRGSSAEEIESAWRSLEARGLAANGDVAPEAIALRQHIEDETDRLTTLPWRLLGAARSGSFARDFEPPCEKLLARVDVTAGPNYQPASRIR